MWISNTMTAYIQADMWANVRMMLKTCDMGDCFRMVKSIFPAPINCIIYTELFLKMKTVRLVNTCQCAGGHAANNVTYI